MHLPQSHAVSARWRCYLRCRGSRFTPLPGADNTLSLRVLRCNTVQLHAGFMSPEGTLHPRQQARLPQRYDGMLRGVPCHNHRCGNAEAEAEAAGVPLWNRETVPADWGPDMFSARLASQRVSAGDNEV